MFTATLWIERMRRTAEPVYVRDGFSYRCELEDQQLLVQVLFKLQNKFHSVWDNSIFLAHKCYIKGRVETCKK